MSGALRLLGAASLAATALAATAAAPAGAQETPRLGRVLGQGSAFLYRVRDAAEREGQVVVLTDSDPAVHLFRDGAVSEWGTMGGGPGELASPVDVEWTEDGVLVLDIGRNRLVQFAEDGSLVASRTIEGTRGRRLWAAEGGTILEAFLPMTDQRAAVRLRPSGLDTLFAFEGRGESVTLEAPGAPSLTVKLPYTPQVEWTVLADGGMVRWEPGSSRLAWLDRKGRRVAATPVPFPGLPLGDADREWWIRAAIPEGFQGRPVFEPLRPVARRTVEYPERLPAVLEMLPDPAGGVWLRRTTPATGERWALLHRDGGLRGEVVLPAGRELLALGRAELLVLARDALDVEVIEAYRRPVWAEGDVSP